MFDDDDGTGDESPGGDSTQPIPKEIGQAESTQLLKRAWLQQSRFRRVIAHWSTRAQSLTVTRIRPRGLESPYLASASW